MGVRRRRTGNGVHLPSEPPPHVPRGSRLPSASALRAELRAEAGPPTHPDLRAYLGAPAPVLGVSAGGLDRISRRFVRTNPAISKAQLWAVLSELWGGKTYDERALAIVLLTHVPHRLEGRLWNLAEGWVDEATGWALSDALASGPIAREAARTPHRWAEVASWVRSPNLWRRRAALYAQNRLVQSGELGRPLRVIHALRKDPEFWVQRAVGTWLRECWKRDPARIRAYLWKEAALLPPVVITVATERASAGYRARLRARARSFRRLRAPSQ